MYLLFWLICWDGQAPPVLGINLFVVCLPKYTKLWYIWDDVFDIWDDVFGTWDDVFRFFPRKLLLLILRGRPGQVGSKGWARTVFKMILFLFGTMYLVFGMMYLVFSKKISFIDPERQAGQVGSKGWARTVFEIILFVFGMTYLVLGLM